MRTRKFYHSLRFKITAGLLFPLLATLAIFSYVQYANQRRLLLENLELSAANAGYIVQGSLQHAMLINDFSLVQQIMDDIVRRQGVLDLFLLDKQGRVVLSGGNQMSGMTMHLSDPTCQACHRYKAASRNETAILTVQGGARVFRNVNAIENEEGCQKCHDPSEKVSGVLITDFSMAYVDKQLDTLRRNSLLWSAGSISLILLIVNLMMSKMVVSRLEQFVKAITRVGEGDLDQRVTIKRSDEIGELAYSFNRMADGLKEKQRLEQRLKERTEELQAQAEKLSALNTLAATVSQSLNLKEVLHNALDEVLELTKLKAGWIVLRDGQGEGFELAAHRGLPEDVEQASGQKIWERCICRDVLERARSHIAYNALECPCAAAECLEKGVPFVHACVPLKSKDQVLGVMSLTGNASSNVREFTQDTSEMLTSIGRQIGIAVENARLYEELRHKEMLRRQLLERVITVQEEERKRIARELHDETSQALTSFIVKLELLEQVGTLAEIQAHLEDLRAEVVKTLDRVHDLALELRPSVLDDLGLVAALRHYFRDYGSKFRLPVDIQVLGLGGQRLPAQVETALYRIVQEALINVARHAQAQNVSVLLEKRGSSVVVIVEDDGKGFDVAQAMDSHLRNKNLGLYGMQERASLLGGTVTIESGAGTGTAVFVEIPLEQKG